MAAEAAIGAAIDQVVELVVPPIKRFFLYLCCFTTNINNLKDEANKLDDEAAGIQMRVKRAQDAVEEILPAVDTLLKKSDEIKAQITTILDEEADVRSGCLKLGARFSLSKRATKTAESVKKLQEDCSKYSSPEAPISQPGPPPAREGILLKDADEFESRKQIEKDIMTVLKGGDVSMIGIYGMGGLGKTTMANIIRNRVLKENVFDETVIAVVSQQVDKQKIQLDIGGYLGLELTEGTPEAVRIQKLLARLSGTKKILLVLDDVWKPIKLEEFGIPRDSKSCTILITSRNRDVLHSMDVENKFGMKILSDEDAHTLFRKKVGTCMNDAEFKSIAKEIVKKCGGLPIALATVGAALKDKTTVCWEDALRELSQCKPEHIGDYSEEVYNALTLSYNFLSSERDKSIFLLCCLFPEDANIDVETLTCFGMGLGIFEGIEDWEDVRNSVIVSIETLRGRSLLLDGEESDDHLRMHDVVRDVCILIAQEKKIIGGNDCQWISSFELPGERTKLPTGFGSPNLRLLFLSHIDYFSSDYFFQEEEEEEEALKLDNDVFEGYSGLSVLSIRGYKSFTSLPHSLKNLKSLLLDSCDRLQLQTISVVGGFVNLEILICRDCNSIKELPLEIKRLHRLKLLDLTRCNNLQRIGHGIISSLLRLEELKMLRSFKRWESEDTEEKENAGIRELEALTNLRCLEIEIQDPALAAEMRHLSPKIKRFHITIRSLCWLDHSYNKEMALDLEREPCLGNSIMMQLLRDTEYLHLRGDGANSVDLAKCQNIRRLQLKECETMQNIITTSMVDDATALPTSIEHLILAYLPKLEGICDGPISSNSFHNLKELNFQSLEALKQLWKSSSQNINVPPLFTNLYSIYIDDCNCLRNLGQLSMAGKDCLPQLQELVIRRCKMMEQVFLWNKEDEIRNDGESQNDHCITKVFSKLKKVELIYLPKLATFYQGMDAIEFPLLTQLSIDECPKLKSMGSNDNCGVSSADIDDESSQHIFCRPNKLSFANLNDLSLNKWNPFCGHKIHLSLLNRLEELRFSKLFGSRSLFSSSVAGNLVNLRTLMICRCDEMLKVIEENKKEDEQVVSGTVEMRLILFPKLENLRLLHLPKLVTFCELECNVKLPSLRDLIILSCDVLRTFTMGSIAAAPNLQLVNVDYDYIGGGTKDLNRVVQQQYMAREEKQQEEVEGGEEEEKTKGETEEGQN